jgi:hypothetical protein
VRDADRGIQTFFRTIAAQKGEITLVARGRPEQIQGQPVMHGSDKIPEGQRKPLSRGDRDKGTEKAN